MFIWSFAGFTELKVQVFKKFRKVVKAVSPILAVLLMIAIAVIAAIVAYFWLMGYIRFQTSKTGKAIQIQSVAHTGTYLLVYTQNVGQGTVRFVPSECLYLDGILQSGAGIDLDTLNEGETATVDAEFPITLGQRIKIKVVTEEGVFAEGTFTIAVFSGGYTLTVTTIGGGIVEREPLETSYLGGTVVQLTAIADPGWFFYGWGEDLSGSDNPVNITMNADRTVRATFTQIEYTLTVTTTGNGEGSVTKTPNQATYHYGDSVTLEAVANVGSYFSGWSGGLSGMINPDSVVINDNEAVTANFTLYQYMLTVTFDGTGTGKVNDGTNDHTASYQQTYTYGTVITLTPTADISSDFTEWVGDGTGTPVRIVIMNGDRSVTVTFTLKTVALTVNMDGTGIGTVDRDKFPPYVWGDVVQLTPIADASSDFAGWTGDGSGSPVRTVQMDGDRSVTATFNLKQFTLTPSAGANGSISPSTPVTVSYGGSQTFTFTAEPGYHVAEVLVDGGSIGNPTFYDFTNVQANHTIHVDFAIDTFTITATAGSGGTIDPSGLVTVDYGNDQAFVIANDTGYHIVDVVVDSVSQGPVSSYTFYFVTANHVISASFAPDGYTLTVNVVGNGSVTKNPDLPLYAPGTVVNLTAVPANGYGLSAWSGDLTGSTNPTSITMSSDKTVTANFTTGTPTSIEWWTWPDQVTLGQEFSSLGILNPGLNNRTIILTFTRPDGTKIASNTKTFWFIFSGLFYAETTPDMLGQWSVIAQFLGDSTYGACTTTPETFQVVATPTYTVSFTQAGVGADAAPIVTYHIDSGSNQQGIVPFTVQVPQGHQITYSYQSPVLGTSGVQYVLTNTNPSSPETINGPETITGTYKTQYEVTFDQTGLDSTSSGTVVTVGGVTRSRSQLPYTNWFDNGTTYSYSSPVSSFTSGKRFALTGVTGPASPITASGTVNGTYKIQYRLTVASAHDSPTPAVGDNWYDDGTSVTASVTSPDQSGGTRYGCTGWSGTGSVPSSGSGTSVIFTINAPSSITWNWIITQFQVSAQYSTSDGSTPSASVVLSGTQSGSPFTLTLTTSPQLAWLDAGTLWSVNNPIPASPTTEQWDATSGTSGLVLSGTNINPTYYHQYQVTFAVSGSGTTSPPVGTDWQNAGSLSISATANPGYTFSSWGSDTSSITFANSGSSSTTATISGPGTITATFTARTTLFYDDFTDGIDPAWDESGSPSTSNSNPAPGMSGGYYAVLNNNEWIRIEVDTTGYRSISLSYWRRGYSLGSGDHLDIEWRVGNSGSYSAIETVTSETWNSYTFDFPASAEDTTIQIRFRIEGGSDDYGWVDDVLVTGIPLPPRTTIFSDDFANPGWKSEWTVTGSVDRSNTNPHSGGGYYARLSGESTDGEMTLTISTTGYSYIRLSYWRSAYSLEWEWNSQDYLYIDWRIGDGSWTNLETFTDDAGWTQSTFTLSGAGDQATIQIRFRLYNCESNDWAYIDDVTVTGVATP